MNKANDKTKNTCMNSSNKRVLEFYQANEEENLAVTDFLKTAPKYLSDKSIHHFGQRLWNKAAEGFEEAEFYLIDWLDFARMLGNETVMSNIGSVLIRYDSAPKQCSDSQIRK